MRLAGSLIMRAADRASGACRRRWPSTATAFRLR
jgi:hypothetical protein